MDPIDAAHKVNDEGGKLLGTLSKIFQAIERITLAVVGLYLLCKKIPPLGIAIKNSFGWMLDAARKSFPAIGKLADFALAKIKKLTETQFGKSVAFALAAPALSKSLLLLAGAAIIAAGTFTKLFLTWTRSASEIKDLSDALNMTTRMLQALKSASEVTRTSMDDLKSAIFHIEKAQSEAASGTEEMQTAFKALGLTMDQVRKMEPKQIFDAIATGVNRGTISVGNMAAMLSVMGRDAHALIPAMKSDIVGLQHEFEKVGIDRNVLDTLDEADKKIMKAWVSAKGWAGTMGAGIASFGYMMGKKAFAVARAGAVFQYGRLKDFKGANENLVDVNAQDQLNYDPEYAESKEKTASLQHTLDIKRSIRAADKAVADDLAKQNAEKKRQLDLEKMTVEQRRESLEAERATLQAQMSQTKGLADREKLQGKILDVDRELVNAKRGEGFRGENRQVDERTRMGLYRGGGGPSTVSLVQKQLSVMQMQLNALQRMVVEQRRTASGVDELNRNIGADQ